MSSRRRRPFPSKARAFRRNEPHRVPDAVRCHAQRPCQSTAPPLTLAAGADARRSTLSAGSLGRAGPPLGARFHGAALAPPCAGAAVHGRGGRQHGATRLAHGAGARSHLHCQGFVAAAADSRRRAGAGRRQIAGRLRPDRADEPGRPAHHHRCADRDVWPLDSQRSGVFPCPPQRHADLALHERRLAAAQRGGQCARRDWQGRADRGFPYRSNVLPGLVNGACRLYRPAAGDPAGRPNRPPNAARFSQHSGRTGPADDSAEPNLPGRQARQGLWDGGIREAPRGFSVRAHLSTD